jgi:hypothetical protein
MFRAVIFRHACDNPLSDGGLAVFAGARGEKDLAKRAPGV